MMIRVSVTVPVVLDTWAKDTNNIEFYSDVADSSIPTIDLGVPNVERGKTCQMVRW